MSRRAKPRWQRSVARERMETLFTEAKQNIKTHPERSHRYVEMALNLSTRHRTRIPHEFRRLYCRHCHHYLQFGVNARVRLNQKRFPKVVVTCMDCGKAARHPYIKEKSGRKKRI